MLCIIILYKCRHSNNVLIYLSFLSISNQEKKTGFVGQFCYYIYQSTKKL